MEGLNSICVLESGSNALQATRQGQSSIQDLTIMSVKIHVKAQKVRT